MAKKKPGEEFAPLRDVDNPTAAFPIGTLAGGSSREATPPVAPPKRRRGRFYDPEEDQGTEEEGDFFEEDELSTEVRHTPVSPRSTRTPVPALPPEPDEDAVTDRIRKKRKGHPAVLALSLVGGVAMALALVALIGMVLLLG